MSRIVLRGFPRKILVVKPSSLGDIVHSLPFLNALRSGFPKAEIHWVVARGLEGLLEGHPMIGRLIIINKDVWKKVTRTGETIREIQRLVRDLRREKYDLVVDLQGLLRSGFITMATGASCRVGFAEAREGSAIFYNRKVRAGRGMHAVDRNMQIARALGCANGEVLFPFPLIGDRGERAAGVPVTGEYAVMVPGARKPANRWPAGRFGELAARLPVTTLVVGSPGDAGLCEEVVSLSGGRALSLAGKTGIRDLIGVMRGARFTVSNDTGPMHIAAALGVPVFAIFGPADPLRTGPYGKGHVIIRSGVACSPCFKRRCDNPVCLEKITVEMVYREILERGL